MTTHPPCGATWTGQRTEHCAVCCQSFAGTEPGDAHRTGPFGDRSCLTPNEMAAGGMWRDDCGVWHGRISKTGQQRRDARHTSAVATQDGPTECRHATH